MRRGRVRVVTASTTSSILLLCLLHGPGMRGIPDASNDGKPHGHSNGAMFPRAWSAHSSGRDARRRSVWIILSVRRISLGGAGMDASNPSRRRIEGFTKWDAPGPQG